MNDEMVLKTQQWLNATYSGKTGYNEIPENGNTGWTTIYALLPALQIELGITATADNFGPSTISKFNARFPMVFNNKITHQIMRILYTELFKVHYGAKDILLMLVVLPSIFMMVREMLLKS